MTNDYQNSKFKILIKIQTSSVTRLAGLGRKNLGGKKNLQRPDPGMIRGELRGGVDN